MEPIETSSPAKPFSGHVPFDLQSSERVIVRARRHPVFLWSKLVGIAALAIVPVAAILIVAGVTTGLGGSFGVVIVAVCALWVLFWAVRGYFTWYKYENDIWVVTNQRLVDSNKNHWFHHSMSSADLINVEDLSIERSGLLATSFNYGNVRCQTSGTQANFVLSGIPEPSKLLSVIDSTRDAARRELGGRPFS
ncbi:MAG: hypothetical protein M0R74_11530 [Dehalococcoidia bacterium]|nr:hypothetical protein [Dehalococcoidia bacterium]